jgi:hypothetical protein
MSSGVSVVVVDELVVVGAVVVVVDDVVVVVDDVVVVVDEVVVDGRVVVVVERVVLVVVWALEDGASATNRTVRTEAVSQRRMAPIVAQTAGVARHVWL